MYAFEVKELVLSTTDQAEAISLQSLPCSMHAPFAPVLTTQ